MAESNSMLEQQIQTVVPENLLGTDFITPNTFTEKLKPSSLDWNQTINKEDAINKFYFTENDGVDFVDESQDLTSAAFSTTEDTTQPVISDDTIKFLGVQTYFHKGEASRKPQTRIRQEKLFTELTGYTVDQLINNDIPQDVLKSSEFQSGINSFYETNSDKITLADKDNLSINDTIALQASGLLWEIGTGMRTDIVTLPLLRKGPKGIAAYLGINFVSGLLNNLAAQRLRGETEISRGEGIASGIVQMIPFGSTAKGLKGYMGAATQGAVTAGTEATIRTGIDEQRFLTKGELATSLTFGTLFGTGLKGTADAFSAIVNKYQGKSAAEIDKLLTKKEKNIIDTIIEKTAKPVYAASDDIDNLSELPPKKLSEGRQKILPGTPHPTDAKKVRGYDGRWVTKKHFDQVTESRKGADEIKAQFAESKRKPTEEMTVVESIQGSDLPYPDSPRIGTEIPRGETAQSGAVFIERVDKTNKELIGEQKGIIDKTMARLVLANEQLPKTYDLAVLELQELNAKQLAELGIKKADIAKLSPRKTINLLKENFDNVRKDLLPGEYRMEGYSESRRKLYKKWFKDDPDVNWVDRQTGAASTIDDEMSIPYLTVKDQPADAGSGGGAVPPRKPPISQGDGPLKGTDTTPHQINPNQVTNAVGSDQQKQFNFIVNRIKQLKDEGAFSQIKTTADTIDGGIKMLADTNKLKEHANMYAKIYNLVPTDELNYALAEAITIATNKTTAINQDLINAINVSKDPASIKQNIDELIESIGEIDEWLRLGIPLRTETGRALRSMQIPTQGVSPADYAKMSAAEKYKLKNLERSSVGIASSEQGLKLEDLKEKLIKAFEEGQETGDYSKLNKLTNTIKRANGSVEKISALYETNLLHKIFSSFNKGNRIFNEIGINALLSAPTTNEINFISGVLETYMSSYELIRGAGSRVELDAAIRHLISLHSNASFARKAFTESFKTSDNYINRGAVKADYQEKFVISSEGKDILSRVYDTSGKIIRFPSQLMTSTDALVQAPNLIASVHYQSHIEGSKLGFKGKDLDNYIKGNVDAIIEYYASNSGKGIKDPILSRILKRSQEFAKRSTFTEDIRTDGYTPFGTTAAGINKMAGEIPAIRTLLSFIRAPTNIIKRQLRRSAGLNKILKEVAIDLESSDPIVRQQTRGQVKVANEFAIVVSALASGAVISQQFSDFIPPVIMTGGGPDWSTTDGRAVYKSILKNGWRPYSVGYLQKNEDGSPKIGENGKPVYKYYSYERLDPLSSWIGLIVDFAEMSPFLTVDEYDDFTAGLIATLSRNLFDRSYLQQVNEAMEALAGNEQVKENFWSKQFAARTPYANFFRYAKQLPGDLLDIVGVSKEDSARFHQKRDKKIKSGDKLFNLFSVDEDESLMGVRFLRKLLNQSSETVPGYSSDLPFLHEHITNEPILYPHRPGLDLFNWVKTSTSKNHPLWTAMALIGKELKEPSDTFTGVGTSKQMEAFRLDTHEYADLKQIINTIEAPKDHPLYPGANIDQAMRNYLKSEHYKANSAIVKENGPLSKNSQIARDEIYLKLKTINSEFINAGQLQWIYSQGTDKIQLQFNKKRTIVEEYLNNIKALSPD